MAALTVVIVPYKGKIPKVAKGAFVAPTAALVGDVTVEEGVSIWFGAVLRGDVGPIVVKAGANLQDNTVVHTHFDSKTVIGENASIAHGAILHNCTIGKSAVVGINAVVLDGSRIGDEAIIAAGSVVAVNTIIPPRRLAVGIPAEVKKEISGNSLWYVKKSSEAYHDLRDDYLKQSLGIIQESGDV
ncbi:MAG: gamma carbonic anhydrase family protein [Dethiobacteria bacterium]|jgi:carbonic anhydrase/acetyltransferase-like protein (isoleucine patch superfamily)